MESLESLGFEDYYYLDGYRIYNAKRKKYLKEISEYRYKLTTKEGNKRSVTLKEIYRKLYNKVFCIDDIQNLEGEEYKEIEGTNGNYYVSNMGNVKSCISNHAILLKPTVTPKGYERLQIIINGQKYNKFVHSLVAEMWLGKPQSLEQEIHHKDFNQRNNNSNNLEYLNKYEHVRKHVERREREQCQTITAIQTKEA